MGKRLYTLANICSSGKAFHLILGYLLIQRQGNKRFGTHVRLRPLSSSEEKLQHTRRPALFCAFILAHRQIGVMVRGPKNIWPSSV